MEKKWRDNECRTFYFSAEQCIFNVVNELKDGRKQSHWIWFIFPQLKGLGRSYNSNLYGIANKEEAESYLYHPVLGKRLLECTELVLNHQDKTARDIFGPDAKKLKSSMTLFACVGGENSIFAEVLEVFFKGERCHRTLSQVNRNK